MLTFNQYGILIDRAFKNANTENDLENLKEGLCKASRAVAGKIKKTDRDKKSETTKEDSVEIFKKLGDVLWHIEAICYELGGNLEKDVADKNIEKIYNRKKPTEDGR